MLKFSLSKLSGQPMHHAVFSRHGFLRCGVVNKPWVKCQQQKGFTILELLVVIGLLGIVAVASTSLLEDNGYIEDKELKAKQTYNENSLPLVRKAIIGDSNRTLNGEAELSGFVADMGRLPNCLRELLEPLDCNDDIGNANNLVLWGQDAETHIWSGWNGPYLQGLPAAGGLKFRDGWGNLGKTFNPLIATPANYDTRNYGWLFGTGAADGTACEDAVVTQPNPNNLTLQSCGQDEQVGGEDDYPQNVAGFTPNLIDESDYRVILGEEWNQLKVELQDEPITKNTLRVRINYPVDGLLLDWADPGLDTSADRNGSPFLSQPFPAFDINDNHLVLPATANQLLIAPSGTTIDGANITINVDGDLVLTDGSILKLSGCPCVVSVPADTVLASGNTFQINAPGGDISVPRSKIFSIQANASGLVKYMISVPPTSTVDSLTQITLQNGASLSLSQVVLGTPPQIILNSSNVTVSESFVLVGNVVTTNVSGDQFNVPTGTTVLGNTLTIPLGTSVPIGHRTITVVCEVDGLLFDGKCSNNANPGGYQPIASPYSLTIVPRKVLKKPVLLPWNIQ